MNTGYKIAVFIAFLVLYALWAWLCNTLVSRFPRATIKEQGYIPLTIAISLISNGAFLFFIWLLSGFFDLRVIGLLLISQALSIFLVSVSWIIVRNETLKWGASVVLEDMKLSKKYPLSPLFDIYIGAITFLAFPVASGWIYFHNIVPSDKNTIQIFKVAIISFCLIDVIITAKSTIMKLSSATIAEQSRDRILVSQLGSFITWGLTFSMILWVFGVGSQNTPTGRIDPFNVSWNVAGVLIAFLLTAYIAPYFLGVQRSKNLQRSFDEETEDVLRNIVKTLKFPRSPSARTDALAKLRQRIDQRTADVRASYHIFGIGDELEHPQPNAATATEERQIERTAYAQAHGQDPCIRHVQALAKLDGDIHELEAAFAEPSLNASMDGASEVFKDELDELRENAKAKERPRMAVLIVAGLSLLASPIVSELGKLVANQVAEAAGVKLGALSHLFVQWA
jgi:hypothetical protein